MRQTARYVNTERLFYFPFQASLRLLPLACVRIRTYTPNLTQLMRYVTSHPMRRRCACSCVCDEPWRVETRHAVCDDVGPALDLSRRWTILRT